MSTRDVSEIAATVPADLVQTLRDEARYKADRYAEPLEDDDEAERLALHAGWQRTAAQLDGDGVRVVRFPPIVADEMIEDVSAGGVFTEGLVQPFYSADSNQRTATLAILTAWSDVLAAFGPSS